METRKKTSLKVRLILYHRGQILLLKQTKPNGGNYTLVGGNIEQKEFAKACLIRESLEEAGIALEAKDLSLAHVLHKRKPNEQRITLYFKAYRWEGEFRTREPKKFKAVEWHPLDQLPSKLSSTVKHVLKAYRSGLIYSEMKG